MRNPGNRSHHTTAVRLALVTALILVTLPISRSVGVLASVAQTDLQLPPGFTAAIVATGLNIPTDMELLPNGDILVAEKGVGERVRGISQLRLIRNGGLQAQPVLTLPTTVEEDSGLLAVVADPNFTQNHHFYIWYAPGIGAREWDGFSEYRLSRFTMNETTGLADPASEVVVLDDVPWANAHGGGGLLFDAQGNLYISTGDATDRESIRDMSKLSAKVLRIRPSQSGAYTIPPDNPFVGLEAVRPEIYALGLRNPFRMARHSDGRILVGDVGDEDWEEIDLLQPAADYGWPVREGPCPRNGDRPCSPAPAPYTDPIISYLHDGGGAVTTLTFYEGERFPPEYHDRLFFADYDQATIFSAEQRSGRYTMEPFATGIPGIVDLVDSSSGLYFLDLYEGEVTLIYHSESANQAPTASLSLDSAFGPAPLSVNFSAAGSSDPNGLALRYHWDFGDGSAPATLAEPTASHKFRADGAYTVKLTVINAANRKSPQQEEEIVVFSGEVPQIDLANLTEPGRSHFHSGDSWAYRATRSAGTEGLDAETPYRWRIDLHHNRHSHPVLVDKAVQEGTFDTAAKDHGGEWNIWYRFYLTTRTESGQEFTIHEEVKPALASITVDSVPRPVSIEVNGTPRPTELQLKAIVGTQQSLEAPLQALHQQGIGAFDHWRLFSDGWPARSAAQTQDLFEPQLTFTVTVSSTTYTAYYVYEQPATLTWLPAVSR